MSVHLHHFRIQMEINSFFGINIAKHRRNLEIETTQYFGQHFYNRNFRSQTVEKTGKFHSDNASADHNERFWLLFQFEYLPIGNHDVTRFL
jgi:hypothetical protein